MKKYIAIKEIKPSSKMMKYWNGLADSEVEGARLDLPQMLIKGKWYTWEDGDKKSVIVYDRKGKGYKFNYNDVEQIKESTSAWEKSLKQAIELDKIKMLSKKDKATLQRIAKLLKKEKENEANEGFSKNLITYAIGLAEKYAGNMTKAVKLIDKIKKGLSDDPKVKAALQAANESVVGEGKVRGAKSQLKKLIRREILREAEESQADKDLAIAKKLKPQLESAIEDIGKSVTNIEKRLSSFNSPGLRVAFLDGIRKSISGGGQKFDIRKALKIFHDYYSDR
jgi:hypothetical protein